MSNDEPYELDDGADRGGGTAAASSAPLTLAALT